MRKVYMLPTPAMARTNLTNSIHRIVLALEKHLPAFGYELTDNPVEADLVAGHAGQMGADARVDVAHCHGLYPTAHRGAGKLWDAMNVNVIQSLRQAKHITVPSQWVADILRRDMGVEPHVIGWGIEVDEWEVPTLPGHRLVNLPDYVLWNKTRADSVCDPTPVAKLAKACPDVGFITTFGEKLPNVKVVGAMPFEAMKGLIQYAAVYLATTKETFGIGTLEAMACGVPVLGFRHGGTTDIVQHGVTGYLVQPDDFDGLVEGLEYCLKHRAILGANARKAALEHSFQRVAEQFAKVYDAALKPHEGVKVSVVIPCYNYEQWVGKAIHSAIEQNTTFSFEVIGVDDGSTDNSLERMSQLQEMFPETLLVFSKTNGGVASARNYGIERAGGEYIVCLDADDVIGDTNFLQTLADALDADRTLGIAYTGLRLMYADGKLNDGAHSFPSDFNFDEQVNGRNQVPTCCMFRKEAWQRAGGYRKEVEPAEDANLWLRITAQGYGAKQITKEGMFHYRLHPNSLSTRVRNNQAREPKWNDFPWVRDGRRPFAAPAPVGRYANPVRNYDRPQVTVIIETLDATHAQLQRALDSVEAQTERFWECILGTKDPINLYGYAWVKQCRFAKVINHVHAPLVAIVTATQELPSDFLEKALKHFQRTGTAYTDGMLMFMRKSEWFDPHGTPSTAIVHTDTLSDMLRVEMIGATGVLVGAVSKHQYGARSRGDLFYVWTVDAAAMTDVLKPVAPVIGIEKTPVPPAPVLVGATNGKEEGLQLREQPSTAKRRSRRPQQ